MCDEWPLRGRGQGHVTYFLNFGRNWDPLRNFWTGEARHLVFSLLDRPRRVLSDGWWMTPKGAWLGSRDLLLNFGTPSITFERVKLEILTFLYIQILNTALYVGLCPLFLPLQYNRIVYRLYRMVIFFWYYLVRGTHWVIGTAWSSA